MYSLSHAAITGLLPKTSLKFHACLLVWLSLLAFSINAHSQALFDPANLVLEVTLPSEMPEFMTSGNTSEENSALLQSISRYQDSIDTIQVESTSPYNFELQEQFSSLGDLYQSLGQHESAITSYDDAIQITKIQNGIYNLDQLPLLDKIIHSYIAMGDIRNATLRQEYRHYLHLENYQVADPEMVQSTFTLAQWYISTYFKRNLQSDNQQLEMAENIPPRTPRLTAAMATDQDAIQAFMDNPNHQQFNSIMNGNIRQISPRNIEHPTLLQVNEIYEELQENIYASDQPNALPIIQTARRVAALSFITKQEMDFEEQYPSYNPNYINTQIQMIRNSQARLEQSYIRGRNALQYIVTLLENFEANPRLLAAALSELGDWQLAYGRIQPAQSNYQQAYAVLADSVVSAEYADSMLNDDIPRRIPMMATHLFTRKSAGIASDINLEFQGYIDVSLRLDNQGNVEEIIFDNVQPEQREIQNLIRSSLRMSKYRPYLRNGELVASRTMTLRFHYAY